MRVLPHKIIKARMRAGLTQRGLAIKAGVHPATVLRIEAGESNGRPASLVAIADALNIDLEDICGDEAGAA